MITRIVCVCVLLFGLVNIECSIIRGPYHIKKHHHRYYNKFVMKKQDVAERRVLPYDGSVLEIVKGIVQRQNSYYNNDEPTRIDLVSWLLFGAQQSVNSAIPTINNCRRPENRRHNPNTLQKHKSTKGMKTLMQAEHDYVKALEEFEEDYVDKKPLKRRRKFKMF